MLHLGDISKLVAQKELDKDMSSLLILGLSRMLGFTQKELCAHMDIDQKRHSYLLAIYQQATRTHAHTPINELFDTADTLKQIVLNMQIMEKEIGVGEPVNQFFVGFPGAEI